MVKLKLKELLPSEIMVNPFSQAEKRDVYFAFPSYMMGIILQVYKRILQDIDLFPGQRPLEKCSPCLTQSHTLFTTLGKINSSKTRTQSVQCIAM